MYFYEIKFIKHDDFFTASTNNEPHLHLFWFNQNDKEFVSDEKMSR